VRLFLSFFFLSFSFFFFFWNCSASKPWEAKVRLFRAPFFVFRS